MNGQNQNFANLSGLNLTPEQLMALMAQFNQQPNVQQTSNVNINGAPLTGTSGNKPIQIQVPQQQGSSSSFTVEKAGRISLKAPISSYRVKVILTETFGELAPYMVTLVHNGKLYRAQVGLTIRIGNKSLFASFSKTITALCVKDIKGDTIRDVIEQIDERVAKVIWSKYFKGSNTQLKVEKLVEKDHPSFRLIAKESLKYEPWMKDYNISMYSDLEERDYFVGTILSDGEEGLADGEDSAWALSQVLLYAKTNEEWAAMAVEKGAHVHA